MGKPDYDFPPGKEPEKLWPIDPRPAIRDAKEAWADLRKVPPWRRQTPGERNLVIFIIVVILVVGGYYYRRDQRDSVSSPPAAVTEGKP